MNHLKYWTMFWIIVLSMVGFLGTGVCGTYIYYNEDGEVVRYLPKKKKVKSGAKKTVSGGYVPRPVVQAPPGETAYKPKSKEVKKGSWTQKKK